LAYKNDKIIGITPAMPSGSSLKFMMDVFPKRAFDVGIAEQHAVTLSAGMATQGMVVFCNIYSTFMQRAYDQIIHDVALQNLPVIFCLDRAGLVGEDGATHHGVFDLAYLRCLPNMLIYAPRTEVELQNILFTAQLGLPHPIAIRYPRGRGITINWQEKHLGTYEKIGVGKGIQLQKGSTIAVISTGTIGNNVVDALDFCNNKSAISHYHFPWVKPMDETLLHTIFKQYTTVISVEDGTVKGGFGSGIAEFAAQNNYTNRLQILGLPDEFIEHGTVGELQQICKIDAKSLQKTFETL
jgi:1-deoxy-D-xylulose-5-phosphate synthase